jgi:hypothetical protein
MIVADDTITMVSKMESVMRKVSVSGQRIEESIFTFKRSINIDYYKKLIK